MKADLLQMFQNATIRFASAVGFPEPMVATCGQGQLGGENGEEQLQGLLRLMGSMQGETSEYMFKNKNTARPLGL